MTREVEIPLDRDAFHAVRLNGTFDFPSPPDLPRDVGWARFRERGENGGYTGPWMAFTARVESGRLVLGEMIAYNDVPDHRWRNV